MRLKAGERRYMRNAVYHKTLQISSGVGETTSRERQEDTWYIATSLSNLDKAYDLWCKYKVETPQRREHLTFCLMVSYTIVAFLGYQIEKTGRAPLVSSYGKSSITWLGIGILNHRKASASALFCQFQRRFDRIARKLAA